MACTDQELRAYALHVRARSIVGQTKHDCKCTLDELSVLDLIVMSVSRLPEAIPFLQHALLGG